MSISKILPGKLLPDQLTGSWRERNKLPYTLSPLIFMSGSSDVTSTPPGMGIPRGFNVLASFFPLLSRNKVWETYYAHFTHVSTSLALIRAYWLCSQGAQGIPREVEELVRLLRHLLQSSWNRNARRLHSFYAHPLALPAPADALLWLTTSCWALALRYAAQRQETLLQPGTSP